MSNQNPTDKQLKNREYQKKYIDRLKQDPEKWAERKAKQAAYKQTEAYKRNNVKQSRNYRKKEKWQTYFGEYFRNWLKEPVNYFSHRCRCALGTKLRHTKLYQDNKAKGNNLDHILRLATIGRFFEQKGILDQSQRKVYQLLVSIANDPINVRYIKKEKNTKATVVDLDKQVKIAEAIEAKYNYICEGFTEFVKGAYND
jgi:hypothetical protein